MTRFVLLGATLLATALASPALAQAVVEDPGYCAQYYPNANCQNYGPGNPLYPGSDRYPYQGYASQGYARMPVVHHRHRYHHSR
jgi:hypothetical protein